jgi:hypothetical protein
MKKLITAVLFGALLAAGCSSTATKTATPTSPAPTSPATVPKVTTPTTAAPHPVPSCDVAVAAFIAAVDQGTGTIGADSIVYTGGGFSSADHPGVAPPENLFTPVDKLGRISLTACGPSHDNSGTAGLPDWVSAAVSAGFNNADFVAPGHQVEDLAAQLCSVGSVALSWAWPREAELRSVSG